MRALLGNTPLRSAKPSRRHQDGTQQGRSFSGGADTRAALPISHLQRRWLSSAVMAETWIELARSIQAKPWNRPGTDKTWVLNALSQHRLFAQEVRNARRVAAR
jgi:hypothetical protein